MIRRLPVRRDANSIRSTTEEDGIFTVLFEDGAEWQHDDPALANMDGRALRNLLEARS